MCLCSQPMTWIDLSETANHILGPGTGPSAEKVPQAWSHLVLGFSSTSSWPVPATLRVKPTQVITAPAHQTQFIHMQLDTFLGHHPTEKVATKPSLLSLQDFQTHVHIEESNRKLEVYPLHQGAHSKTQSPYSACLNYFLGTNKCKLQKSCDKHTYELDQYFSIKYLLNV